MGRRRGELAPPGPLDVAALDAKLIEPEGCLPFESRAPQLAWYRRGDVLWMGFGANPQYSWHSSFQFSWTRVLSPFGPKWTRERIEAFTPPTTRLVDQVGGRLERVIAALTTWRVMTTHQLIALDGTSPNNMHATLRAAYDAGLVERGILSARVELARSMPYLWRLRQGPELAAYMKAIGDQRALYITLGQELGAGGHDRHDIISTEIALRAAEVVPGLQGALGEQGAAAKVLLENAASERTRGDVVLYRHDGLRIVLEITTQPKIREVQRKMSKWGRLLGERGGPDGTGVLVIFVAANHERTQGTIAALQRNHDRALTPEGLAYAGNPAPPDVVRYARAGILVAHWKEWFPAQWFISEDFAGLRAHYATAPGRWGGTVAPARSEGPDAVEFAPSVRADWAWMRKVRRSLLAVPQWSGGPVRSVIRHDEDLAS